MSYAEVIQSFDNFDFDTYLTHVTDEMVLASLAKERKDRFDLLNFLSPKGGNHIEAMAQQAHLITKQRFGNTMQLYIPLYVSNYCSNECVYCGFNRRNKIARKHLTMEEIDLEAQDIAKTGIQHILLLTGESDTLVTFEYLAAAITVLKRYFASITLEVYPLSEDQYKELQLLGVDGLTIYQETYNTERYAEVHPKGKKSDYLWRLNTPERGAKAGIRSIGIGPLFGLDDIRKEAFFAALHGEYIMQKYPSSEVSLSLPRINSAEGDFTQTHILDDKTFVQTMVSFRLFLPEAGINISTRENSWFRNHLMQLGVTKMSAGSKTTVGGYYESEGSTPQFETSDNRSIVEFVHEVKKQGYQVVYKDWEPVV